MRLPRLDLVGRFYQRAFRARMAVDGKEGTETLEATLGLQRFGPAGILNHQVMTGFGLDAVNSLAHRNQLAPRPGSGAAIGDGVLNVRLPPHSY